MAASSTQITIMRTRDVTTLEVRLLDRTCGFRFEPTHTMFIRLSVDL